MREGRSIVLIAVTSGLMSVMLAVAVNVATGGTLPGPLSGASWLAWPAVAVLAAIAVTLAILQQTPGPKDPPPVARSVPRELPAAVTTFAGKSDLAAANRVLADGCRVLAVAGRPARASPLWPSTSHTSAGTSSRTASSSPRCAVPTPTPWRRRRCSPASSTASACRKTSAAAAWTTSRRVTGPPSPTARC
ncbi:hypothetical protein Phou_093700 [Phytohabitans houttuyneae]|uniref:Uncharacterized protein n=1 Tax=Phytohabitans houttuyneae TaxID=1076126 RepID=A0A6V8KP63_9ACTN|nr:hypothetical protein Phou_093700 [Phytohabitans houttuyneae]